MSDQALQQRPYPELTWQALVFGTLLGVLMTSAFVYVGLKLGFGLGGSTVAAILGFVVLRALGSGTIIENNVAQTIASAINVSSSGVIFTLPALLLLGEDFSWPAMILSATAGSFMGVVLIIPLRKQMLEFDRLRFPSGMAVASILRSSGGGKNKAILLGIGAAISGSVLVLIEKLHILPASLPIGDWLHIPSFTGTALSLSIMNIGAGLLSGKGGLPFVFGGVLAWWIIAPAAVASGWIPPEITGDAVWGELYFNMLRPVGIGILIGGALAGVFAAFPAIRAAIKTLSSAAKLGAQGGAEELSAKTLGYGLGGALLLLYCASALIVGPWLAIPVALVGALWLALAGMIVAQATGMTDISPLSGMALIGVTLMLAITGGQVAAAVLVGVAVCVGIGQCADMMQDLKTGHLVGGIPKRQQMAQIFTGWLGPLVAVGTVYILWNRFGVDANGVFQPGFGPESQACLTKASDCLSAPQAGALQGMIEGVVGGNAPVDKYLGGGLLGLALGALPTAGVGVLVGLAMYLPFEITLGYGVGCLSGWFLEAKKGRAFFSEKVVPLAAGFIVGEAITALVLTAITMIGG
jgi:putative OPT family oligopeptide transporter